MPSGVLFLFFLQFIKMFSVHMKAGERKENDSRSSEDKEKTSPVQAG